MKIFATVVLSLAMAISAFADLTYSSTVKSGPGAGTVTKHFLKGNRSKAESANSVIITDYDAQTVTILMPANKTYRVTPMSQSSAAMEKAGGDIKADVKETGAKKSIGGFNCKQVIMTLSMTGQTPMNVESEMWVSPDVPGAAELKAMGMRMAEKGVGASGSTQMQKALADIQRQTAKIGGVPVLTIMRMKQGDDAQSKQMQAQMQAARAQMEALKKQGGPAAAAVEKAMANLPAAGGKYSMEVTTESSGFTTTSIPASEFTIPAGYKKADR